VERPATRLVTILKSFQSHCGDPIQAKVAFAGYILTQRDTLDRMLVSGDGLDPDEEVMALYSTMATQELDEYKDHAIEEFVPDFERELRSKQIDELRARIDERTRHVELHMTQRTDFKSALFANLAAWAVSILITAAVIVLFLLPGLEDSLAERLRPAIVP